MKVLKIIGFLIVWGILGAFIQMLLSFAGLRVVNNGGMGSILVIASNVVAIFVSYKLFFGKKKAESDAKEQDAPQIDSVEDTQTEE